MLCINCKYVFEQEYPGAKDQGAEPHSKIGYTKLVKVKTKSFGNLRRKKKEFDFEQKLSRVFKREAEHTRQEKLLLTCATGIFIHQKNNQSIIDLIIAAARHRIEAGYEVEEVCQ